MSAFFILARIHSMFSFLADYGRATFLTISNLEYKLMLQIINIKIEFSDEVDRKTKISKWLWFK